MEYIPHHDRYLDPPDEPDYSECDNCGEIFYNDDLEKMPDGQYFCESCIEEMEELEEDVT